MRTLIEMAASLHLAMRFCATGTLPKLPRDANFPRTFRGKRGWSAVVAGALLLDAAAYAQVTPPLPDGPLTVNIRSTSRVVQPFAITSGSMAGFTDSLIPMGVNESKNVSYAQFQIVSPVSVKITFSSDDGGNFDRLFDFTPGIYFVGMQYTSPLLSSDYADLWIQKFDGRVFGPKLLEVRKSADSYVHAFFRTASSGASGLAQVTTTEHTVSVDKTLNIPGGDATFNNSDSLWPTGLYCPSPTTCAPMTRTISAGGASVTLSVSNGMNSASGVLPPSRYDRIDASSSGTIVHLVHTRIPFVPPGAPTIDALPAQAPITAAYGVRTLTLTGIGDGTDGEMQALHLSAVSSDTAVIPAPELIYHPGDSTATLHYRAAPGAVRKATITVTVTDDGGTPGYPADDQSTTMSFQVSALARRACDVPACHVYVTQRDNALTEVIDAGTNIAFDDNLRGSSPLAISPDGRQLYSVVGSSFLITNPATHDVLATLTLPDVPTAMAQSPSGDRLYLTIPARLIGATDALAVVDTGARTVTQFDLGTSGFADGIVSSLDGRRLYVSTDDGELLTVSTPALRVLGSVAIDDGPHHLAASPGGDRVYVVSRDHNNVAVVDTIGQAMAGRIATGNRPEGIALTPDGKKALLSVWVGAYQGRIDTIDTTTLTVTGSTGLNGLNGPKEIALTPDGTRAYVSFETDRSVVVLSTLTGRIVKTIPIGTPTIGMVMAPLPLLPLLMGDVTHDGVVDQRDVARLLADLNLTVNASACGLACDLDADGVITVLDARRMVNLCTVAGCGAR
ncbi:hypothetical protein GCM10027277_58110 [Pseudoduganella ginsengisoli]|uniref:Beta-propeller fold lactonase family protein n=1 Tax=Pseudoduganella ginsengisoli TaxID=1462440 RepID=A0A6L6PZ60_9BURK|nr:dockerin type I domain-containing protein [Pseudoduganella ginsengisoli]MTW02421.1 hypothetical protein [Pseudoduganella ginsengisoli]